MDIIKNYLSNLENSYPQYDWNYLYTIFGIQGIQSIETTLKEVIKK